MLGDLQQQGRRRIWRGREFDRTNLCQNGKGCLKTQERALEGVKKMGASEGTTGTTEQSSTRGGGQFRAVECGERLAGDGSTWATSAVQREIGSG